MLGGARKEKPPVKGDKTGGKASIGLRHPLREEKRETKPSATESPAAVRKFPVLVVFL
jgi:hypothetical protein